MPTRQVRVAISTGLREFGRTPVLLALLVVAPAYLIGLFGYLAPETPSPVDVPGAGQLLVPLANVLTVGGVTLVNALVGGLVGLFVVQSATDADGRLVIAGFQPASLLLARGTLIGVAAVVTGTVSLAVALVTFEPANLAVLAAAGLLTALTYGMVGVIVGSQVDTLPGIWILLFVPFLDVYLFQNPLATETTTLATVLPAHATTTLALDAAFEAGIQWSNLTAAVAYLLVTTAVATALYYRAT